MTSEEELTSMAAEVESNLEQRCSPRITKRGSVPIVTRELSAALDRANVSNHTATFILAETARSLGHGISSFTVNPESIRKARLKFREHRPKLEKSLLIRPYL